MTLKRVVFYHPPDDRPIGEPCPECGGETRKSMIPCPEGRPGCCVMHYGYICQKCNGIFQHGID